MVPKFETILMPTDFSPPRTVRSSTPLRWRNRRAPRSTWCTWWRIRSRWRAGQRPTTSSTPGCSNSSSTDAERQIAGIAKSIAGVKVTTAVLEGNPSRVIVAAAGDRKCQLIVMGTHGRGGLSHLVLGSVAERVVRTAPCPVLTVPVASTAAEKPAASSTG